MCDIVGERNPSVLRLLPDRSSRRGEVGVTKSADGNTDMVFQNIFSGATAAWEMSGTSIMASQLLWAGDGTLDWRVVGSH